MLLEVLPALLILLLALTSSLRLVWTAVEHHRALAAASWRQRVLPVVWEAWKEEDSDVVLVHETDNGLETRFFPNFRWLPRDSRETGARYTLMLLREPAEFAGRRVWRISRLVPAAGGEFRRSVYLTVLQSPSWEEGRAR